MLKKNNGVSLITLIITIIVVIILAVIVMRGTGGTIEQANYSSYMDDLGKVKEAVETKAMEVKGQYLIDGRTVSMEEIYNYVAKGGKTGDDFLGKVNVPAYTIIDRENADIGIEIPTRNIESGTGRNVEIQYIVTKEGEVFAWPPYEYEDKLYITENVTVPGKLDKDIQIEDENITLNLDAVLGIVLPASGDTNIGGGTGGEQVLATSGLYAEDGTIIKTWDELVADGSVTVSENSLTNISNEMGGYRLIVPGTIKNFAINGMYDSWSEPKALGFKILEFQSGLEKVSCFMYGCGSIEKIIFPSTVTNFCSEVNSNCFNNCFWTIVYKDVEYIFDENWEYTGESWDAFNALPECLGSEVVSYT